MDATDVSESSEGLLSFALTHARKRLRVDGDDHTLLDTMIHSALRRPPRNTEEEGKGAGGGSSSDLGPGATSQLLSVLISAVGRPDIVHADEAAASSSEDDTPACISGPSASSATTPPSRVRGGEDESPSTIYHPADSLPDAMRAKISEPDGLVEEVKELLGMGADASANDGDGNSLLYLALHVPNSRAALAIIHALLRKGASPHVRRHGGTILHHALRLRRPPLVQRLVREGAYPARSGERMPPPDGRRLASVAAANGFSDEARALMRRALRVAASQDDHRAARGLLLHGCPPEDSLLYQLVRARRAPRVVHALLAAGADANYADSVGTHLLTLAAMQGDVSLARALLEAGADPSLEEDDGQTVLELARSQATNPEIVALCEGAVASAVAGAVTGAARGEEEEEAEATQQSPSVSTVSKSRRRVRR